jgi:arylsulfatase A-like enzyme
MFALVERASIRLLLALLCLAGCGPAADGTPARIVLIVVDTLRADALGDEGGFSTPNMDALAAAGDVFLQAFGSYYQTPMSMGAMFTGRTPSLEGGDLEDVLPFSRFSWCGLERLREKTDRFCIPESVPTLAERMREAGYATIGVTSNLLLFPPHGLHRGFDDWQAIPSWRPREGVAGRSIEDHKAARAGAAVNRAVEAALDRRTGDHFFLYAHYMDAHDYDAFGREAYARGVERADAAIGALLTALEQRGLRKGTVFVLTADHGERLGERHFTPGTISHGGNPSFEEVLRIPLVVSPSRRLDTTRMIRTQDVFGLVLTLAGAEVERPHEHEPAHDELFIAEPRYRTYRHGRFKSYVERESGTHVLVDLAADPDETRDVASDHPDVVRSHTARIEALATALSAGDGAHPRTMQEDERRLRALGYLE